MLSLQMSKNLKVGYDREISSVVTFLRFPTCQCTETNDYAVTGYSAHEMISGDPAPQISYYVILLASQYSFFSSRLKYKQKGM